MKTPKPRTVGPMAAHESAVTHGVAAAVMAAASAAVPPGQAVPQFVQQGPPPNVQMAAPSVDALVAQGAVQEAAANDGIIMNEHAAQKLGLRRRPVIEQKVVQHRFAHYEVYGKRELLGVCTKATDESDAIAQMVAAYKITDTEQWMFVAKKIPGTEYTL